MKILVASEPHIAVKIQITMGSVHHFQPNKHSDEVGLEVNIA